MPTWRCSGTWPRLPSWWRELELACQVGKVGRALSWHRALRMGGAEEAGEFADAPLRALASLLSDSWLAAV
jgi:hypothetical protein